MVFWLSRLCSGFESQADSQKDKELVEEPNSFICRPEEGIGNDSSFGRRPSGIHQRQKHPKRSQRTSEEEQKSQEPSGQGKRQIKLAQKLRTRVQDALIGAFRRGQCLQYGQDSYGIHSQRAGKDEHELSTQIIDEIQSVKYSIDVELDKFYAKLNEIASDIIELKGNDKRTLKDNSLEIIDNTNQFAIHLARNDSERQKLKNEIIENVEQIHKNYEPHIPRHYTPFKEEKPSVKGSLTPFLGENPICEKDIPKLEESPTFSGEGEYNHIEFMRAIDMLQEDFNIPE
ncbi:hypothetical protein O181_103142 [Austropuccinia psidii MF-1]|uniref:Uncharacterized protein n=1 Tax=Austropuccinia psidii MF-1 TaxID=1389203 RepID=A0A9Q3JJ92_9BASI|nr:hypothetical protein [Austropuccinia psidii MF-1]